MVLYVILHNALEHVSLLLLGRETNTSDGWSTYHFNLFCLREIQQLILPRDARVGIKPFHEECESLGENAYLNTAVPSCLTLPNGGTYWLAFSAFTIASLQSNKLQLLQIECG